MGTNPEPIIILCVAECPVQMEGVVHDWRAFGENVSANCFEVHIVKLHADESLLIGDGARPHLDPTKWRPVVMNFCRFVGIGGEVYPSRLTQSDFMKFVLKGTAAPQPANPGA